MQPTAHMTPYIINWLVSKQFNITGILLRKVQLLSHHKSALSVHDYPTYSTLFHEFLIGSKHHLPLSQESIGMSLLRTYMLRLWYWSTHIYNNQQFIFLPVINYLSYPQSGQEFSSCSGDDHHYQIFINNKHGRNSLGSGPSHAISIKSCRFSWARKFLRQSFNAVHREQPLTAVDFGIISD